MPSITESVSVLNSAVRTVLALAVVGVAGVGGWFGYTKYNANEIEAHRAAEALEAAKNDLQLTRRQLSSAKAEIEEKDQKIDTLNVRVEEQALEIDRLDTAMRLLKVDHRVARISVLDQTKDAETGTETSLIQFQELNQRGEPVEKPREFQIKGDLVYVDSWVVKFDDKYVEEADIDRATSLVLFRRIFGEYQEPNNGFALDQVGARPTVYGRGGKMTDFERRIWDDFWNVANDEGKQETLGIRAAHGDAPSIKVQKGKAYRVELRASDGLSITPEGDAPQPAKPAA